MGVELNNKWGFIDRSGKEVVQLKYDDLEGIGFSEGRAGVKLNDKWGYVDKYGNEVIKPQYEVANTFVNGKAKVKKDGKEFYIDKPAIPDAVTTKAADGPAKSVTIQEPPVSMNGQVDAGLVGAWLWDPKGGAIATIYNFNADGTYEFYVGSSFHPDLRWYKDVTLYWRVNGNTLETYSKDWKEVAKTPFEKKNDAATNRPAIVMQMNGESRAFISMDNKPLFAGIPTLKINNYPENGHDQTILGLWKYQYPNSTNSAYIKLNADGSYESYNNSVTPANRTDKGKCRWNIEDGMFVLTCEGSAATRNTIKKKNDPSTGKPTLVIAEYYPYFSMDNKAPWK